MYTLEGISSVAHFTIVQIMFHFLWDHWAHCGIFENGSSAHVYARGHKQCCTLHHSADYVSFPLGSLGSLWYI